MVNYYGPPYVNDTLRGKKHNYQVLESIQAGGTHARLYKVSRLGSSSDTYLAKFFAVPRIREFKGPAGQVGTDNQRHFKRYKKEPRFLKLFRHPNIVRCIDEYEHMESGSSDDCFYVMEFLVGKSLENHIVERTVPPDYLRIAREAASALFALHSYDPPVVHRDLHPGNLYVSNGVTKVIDFGCSIGGNITRYFKYEGDGRTNLVFCQINRFI